MLRLTGHDVVRQLKITPTELLEHMRAGRLHAVTMANARVYDEDSFDYGPSQAERIAATRAHVIEELRRSRVAADPEGDVLEFPEGFHGMSFTAPREASAQGSYFNTLLALYFDPDEVQALQGGSYEHTANVSKLPIDLRCEPGTDWSKIKITIMDDENLDITTPKGRKKRHYAEMGFKDGRKTNSAEPNWLWRVLLDFAENDGIDPSVKNPCKTTKILVKTISRLDQHLQKLFGIQERAFTDYRAKHKWLPKFILSDRRRVFSERPCSDMAQAGEDDLQSVYKEEQARFGEDRFD
jgi:hypothetical protein